MAASVLWGASPSPAGTSSGEISVSRISWVVAPQWVQRPASGPAAWESCFTSPTTGCIDAFDTDPGSALAYAYDFVCNGNEVGGGSIRIHRRDIQERVFKVMGINAEQAQEKFGFLLDAFSFGAPPHGGIALGWDRVIALLAGADSIREVIAFPKTGNGYDPLTAAPAPITTQQRKEAGVDAKPEPQAKKAAAAEDVREDQGEQPSAPTEG